MDLLLLLIGIALVGLVVYVLITYVAMPSPFKQVIIVVAVIAILIYVARWIGVPMVK